MRPFSLLIKPTSADCNLHCKYCFYLEKSTLYPDDSIHRMSDTVLEKMVQSYMGTVQSNYSFGWQGGEPLLMGVEFFQKTIEFQKKYGQTGANASNGVQTNATLINEKMAKLFKRYNFLLGCSLDGPANIHDHYRTYLDNRPSHHKVLKGIDTLKRNQVDFNILVLVNKVNVEAAGEIYSYLVDRGYYHHQYIPCVEFDEQGELMPFSITAEEWGRFMCQLFDQWIQNDIYRVSIRHFDSMLHKMVYGTANLCMLDENCCQYFVVEHNGDIYPCDFFVRPELKLGNVMDTTWQQAMDSEIYQNFGRQKKRWDPLCSGCDCLNLCAGDCLKHRQTQFLESDQLSFLCEGWKRFLHHSEAQFRKIAAEVMNRSDAEAPDPLYHTTTEAKTPPTKSTGRNSPCPCGSGLKYKKCCGR